MALELRGYSGLQRAVPKKWRNAAAEKILQIGLNIEKFDGQTSVNLAAVRDALTENPRLNFIGYFNHNALSDPIIAAHVYWTHIDPQRSRRVIIPASDWHMHPGNNRLFGEFFRFGAAMEEFEIIPIVQDYMIGDDKYINFRTGKPYTPDDAKTINGASSQHLLRASKSDPIATLLAPEGTRGKLDVMQSAQPGIETMARALTPGVVLPMGIEFDGDHGRGLNLHVPVKMHVAEPFTVFDRKSAPTVDDYMIRLAGALPPHLRGVYADRISQPGELPV